MKILVIGSGFKSPKIPKSSKIIFLIEDYTAIELPDIFMLSKNLKDNVPEMFFAPGKKKKNFLNNLSNLNQLEHAKYRQLLREQYKRGTQARRQ